MTIDAHIESFAGLPVHDYSPDDGIASPASRAFRISIDWQAFDSGQKFDDHFAAFTADAKCPEVLALIIGDWGGAGQGEGAESVVESLVSARARLPKLRALFFGEMVVEESEISWITQADVSPLFEAFPQLEELWIRGGNDLRLGRPRHAKLRKLVIETGGMPAEVVRELATADLPALEHLELWLGDDGYGNDVTSDDVRALLAAPVCRRLTYLGLRNDCRADDTVKVLAETGVALTLKTLDLSLGALGDDGANVVADSKWAASLEKLDIHFHYVSPAVIQRLKKAVRQVDASDPKEPDDWGGGDMHRYISVSE